MIKNTTILILFATLYVNAQTAETYQIETRGTSLYSEGENLLEFYEYRGAFAKRKLDTSVSLLTGLNHIRIENRDFFEFPFLFQYQISTRIEISVGPQLELMRDRETSSFSLKGTSFSIGVDYDFTPSWDASIQFIQPIFQEEEFEQPNNLLAPKPIRLRTGFKF